MSTVALISRSLGVTIPVMWLTTTNDRKLIPAIYGASGCSPEQLAAPSSGIYGASIFASGGEILSLRRPIAQGAALDAMIGNKIRSVRVLATTDFTEGRIFRPLDTQPFRHKGWVFAMEGDDAPASDAADEYEADFLSRNTRGNTHLEQLANRVMCGLFRRRDRVPSPEIVRDCVLAVLEPLASDDFASWCAILTGETFGVVVSRNHPVYYRTVKGGPEGRRPKAGLVPGYGHLRATVVVTGFEPDGQGWTTLEEGQTLLVGEIPPATPF